jgi:hypothetical protein
MRGGQFSAGVRWKRCFLSNRFRFGTVKSIVEKRAYRHVLIYSLCYGRTGSEGLGRQYSQKELIKIAKERGWEIDETRGKGSHVLAMKAGKRPFPIPRK